MPRRARKAVIQAALTKVVRAQLVLWDELTKLESACNVSDLPRDWIADFACNFDSPDDAIASLLDVDALLADLKELRD